MKTLNVRFVDGPLDGQSRDIAIPPAKFYSFDGYYEQDSISEKLGFAVYVWIPEEDIPGCLKPLDAIEYASQHDSEEKRRFSGAWIDETGKVHWDWR